MKIERHNVKIFGYECEVALAEYSIKDAPKLKIIFNSWLKGSYSLKNIGARGFNIPEGMTEVLFCLYSGSYKLIKIHKKSNKNISSSFDTFNIKSSRAEQIKACSVEEDLTSFGPRSRWDDLYFLDFYNGGNINGTFDVYKIPDKYLLDNSVNKSQKFIDQQTQKRRPRLSIKKDIIQKYNLKPEAKGVKFW